MDINPYERLEIRKFVAPEFVFGEGARKLVGQYCRNFGAGVVLLVTDPGVKTAGWSSQVAAELEQLGIPYVVFERLTPNPKDYEILSGVNVYVENQCDMIVAVGGGSPMDCAKGIGITIANNGNILDFKGVDEIPEPGPPLICIPTTAGTSADVSQFAIVLDSQKKVKTSIVSKSVVPDVALVDPRCTTTMPTELAACTGMDALAHAFEAYVSNAGSPLTDHYALQSIRRIVRTLLRVMDYPENMAYRDHMMLASLEAGLAFSNAGLGLVHAMAHSLGGFLDLPHGECNAILLEHVVDYNFESCEKKYMEIARAMDISLNGHGSHNQKRLLIRAIQAFREKLGLRVTLKDAGVLPRHIPRLAAHAFEDVCLATNPVEASPADIEVIYEKAL